VSCEETASVDRYRPSAELAEFVPRRDLTCRFPGCEQPAEFNDISIQHESEEGTPNFGNASLSSATPRGRR
jgi:hypothetical protein